MRTRNKHQWFRDRNAATGWKRVGGGGRILPALLVLAGISVGMVSTAWGQPDRVGATTTAGIATGAGGPIVAEGTASHEGQLGHSRVNTRVHPDGSALSAAGAFGVGRDGTVAFSKTYVVRETDGTLIGGNFQLGVDPTGRGQVNLGGGVVPGGHPGGGGALRLGGAVQRDLEGWRGDGFAVARRDDAVEPGGGAVEARTESRSRAFPAPLAFPIHHQGRGHHPAPPFELEATTAPPRVVRPTVPRRYHAAPPVPPPRGRLAPPAPLRGPLW